MLRTLSILGEHLRVFLLEAFFNFFEHAFSRRSLISLLFEVLLEVLLLVLRVIGFGSSIVEELAIFAPDFPLVHFYLQ